MSNASRGKQTRGSKLFDISDKVALITGANAGIGLGYAEAIAREGGDVVIWGRRKDRNEEAREKLAVHGFRVMSDVADEAQQIRGFEKALAEMGHLDCVIANAGFTTGAPFKDLSSKMYHELIQVVSGDSPHKEFLERHGEGQHHVRCIVSEIDPVVARAAEHGFESIWSHEMPGTKLRWAYLEREGTVLELVQGSESPLTS